MAFNASACLANDLLAPIGQQALQMKAQAERESTALAVDGATSDRIIRLYEHARQYRALFQKYAGVPGIVDYAQEQVGQDVSAGFLEMRNALDALTAEINTAFPKNAGGYLLGWTLGADKLTERQFGAAEAGMVAVRGRLDTLAATVV